MTGSTTVLRADRYSGSDRGWSVKDQAMLILAPAPAPDPRYKDIWSVSDQAMLLLAPAPDPKYIDIWS